MTGARRRRMKNAGRFATTTTAKAGPAGRRRSNSATLAAPLLVTARRTGATIRCRWNRGRIRGTGLRNVRVAPTTGGPAPLSAAVESHGSPRALATTKAATDRSTTHSTLPRWCFFLELADLGVAVGDARLGPLGDRAQEPAAQLLALLRIGREM